MLPSKNFIDIGTTQLIYSALKVEIVSRASPIIAMRSQKNEAERQGVRYANIRDAVAFCESMRIFEEKVKKRQVLIT